MDVEKSTLRARYKAFRRALLEMTPLIKRRRHNKLMGILRKQNDYERAASEALGAMFLEPPKPASAAGATMPIPMRKAQCDELCLFVTHAASAELKPHVIDHINALIDAKVEVVLIVNTDLDPAAMLLPPELASRLYGCLIRENVGFDFAAWSHAYVLIDPSVIRRRLYFINDSIVGPIDLTAYRALLQKVRDADGDMVGLTMNPDPHDHLQSYFLVFNERLLRSAVFDTFARNVVNMPLKQNVIDCYEIWLSPFFEKKSFNCVAIFPKLSRNPPPRRNDTVLSWQRLVQLGFPFVKSMVVRDPSMRADVERLVPEKYR